MKKLKAFIFIIFDYKNIYIYIHTMYVQMKNTKNNNPFNKPFKKTKKKTKKKRNMTNS